MEQEGGENVNSRALAGSVTGLLAVVANLGRTLSGSTESLLSTTESLLLSTSSGALGGDVTETVASVALLTGAETTGSSTESGTTGTGGTTLRAVSGDVAGLTTLVAGGTGTGGTTDGGTTSLGALSRDVAGLATLLRAKRKWIQGEVWVGRGGGDEKGRKE